MTIQNLNKGSGNNYILTFPKLPITEKISDSMPLELNIFGTIVPGISLTVSYINHLGFKQKMSMGDLDYNSWDVNFTVDEDWKNWNIIVDWIYFISNNKDKVPGDKGKYSVDASLLIFDNFNNKVVKKIVFSSIWPSNIGDVELSERDGQDYLRCSCQFVYDYYSIEK